MTENIYPNADADEVRRKAKKSPMGRFWKEYKKGAFVYQIEKHPFKQETIAAVHLPTKRVFGWSIYFHEWNELPFKFDEYGEM